MYITRLHVLTVLSVRAGTAQDLDGAVEHLRERGVLGAVDLEERHILGLTDVLEYRRGPQGTAQGLRRNQRPGRLAQLRSGL